MEAAQLAARTNLAMQARSRYSAPADQRYR